MKVVSTSNPLFGNFIASKLDLICYQINYNPKKNASEFVSKLMIKNKASGNLVTKCTEVELHKI